MGDLVQIQGFQLVVTFGWTCAGSDEPDQEVFRFGSFRTKWKLKKWEGQFIKCLEEELELEKDRINCWIISDDIESFDPKGTFFLPQIPQLAAEEMLDILLSWNEEKFPETVKGPFLWEAIVRLKIKKSSALAEMPVAIFPFEGREHVTQWVGNFLAAISNRKAAFGNLRLQILDEGVIGEDDHFFGDDDFEIDEYVLSSELDPEEEGKVFFAFLMQNLVKRYNQLI